jgi:hypothetical protein
MKHTAFPLGAIVAALALAGCGGSDAEPASSTPVAGAAVLEGGLTIAEAIASTAEGPLLVKGYLFDDDGKLRLCTSGGADGCGEPSLRVEGNVVFILGAEQTSLLGEVADGVLTVDPTAIASG